VSAIPLPSSGPSSRTPRRFGRMPEGAELLGNGAYKVLGAILLGRKGNSPYVVRDDHAIGEAIGRHPNSVRRHYPEIERSGILRRDRLGGTLVFVLCFDLAGAGEADDAATKARASLQRKRAPRCNRSARLAATEARASHCIDDKNDHRTTHHDGGRGDDLPIESKPEPTPDPGPPPPIEGRCREALAAADGDPSGPRGPVAAGAVRAAVAALAGRLGTNTPGMLAARLWRAVDDRGGPRRRLLEAARRADRALGYGIAPAEVGHDFVRHCDGHDFPQPVHPESEAAGDARRLAEASPPGRPAWSFSPTRALAGSAPPDPGPPAGADPPPAAGPRRYTEAELAAMLRSDPDARRRRFARFGVAPPDPVLPVTVPITARKEPPAASLPEIAAGGREQAR
jgi:hypothetical protein